MASKGSKNGAVKPAASKAAARPKVAPKPKVAVIEAEKPEPVAIVAEPAPVLEAATQEVENIVEAPLEAVAEATVENVETIEEKIVEPVGTVLETVTEAVTAQPVVEAAVKEAKIMETIENNFAKSQALFGEFNERAQAAVAKSTKLVEEANDFAKGNLEAIVESGKITAKGLESFGQDAAEYSRKSFETATAALKTMSGVKSPTEFFKLQSDFFRASFDSYVAEASKNTEALIKLAGDAAQPLSSRVAVAAEKVKVAA